MAALVAPIWILAVALMVYINRRTLRPIRDLIDTVETIRSSRELSARVPVRDDRSELGRLSVQVNAMLATIGQLVNGMRESLDHVAHDLRTPLARLRLNLEQQLLQPQETLTAQQIQALSESIEECGRIESMLKTLMDIAEAEYGLLQLDYQPLDGARLLREMAELYQYSAEDAGISVHLRAEGPIPLEADPNRLRQVLANLIDNAIKYTPAGGEVRLEAHAGTDAVLFRISDSGIGIAAADRPHIYQRLFRGDRSRSSKGLGLGLSLVRAIAEAHHGCVSETSAPGAGSCFEVRLPASRRRPPAPFCRNPFSKTLFSKKGVSVIITPFASRGSNRRW
ncbi:sensor histidine kinase [Marinobacterium aestuariivivens]|uniref:histidine kinase n=1 Tax=Marinobacterium aestuariivivens TaxID=1698799 RepID=A0ABW2A6Q0_9GAMM